MSTAEFLHRLLTEGILPGVTSVLSFIPTIAFAIFVLSLLRESGIVKGSAARFLMGFSCSVPAIMSCQSIPDKNRQLVTTFLIPFMSCSAKLPIYVLLASTFFPAYPIAAIGAVYTLGIIIVILGRVAAKLAGLWPPCEPVSLRVKFKKPSMGVVLKEVLECCIGFIKKAFTVILAASIIIWLLQNFDTKLVFTSNIEESLLARLGMFFSPAFEPLGFGDWRAVSALITGLSAKEAVVSTFAVIAGTSEGPALWMMLKEVFSPLSAFCFMVFCLLYMPCIATLSAMRTITGKLWVSIAVMASQTAFAWVVTFLIFQLIKVII